MRRVSPSAYELETDEGVIAAEYVSSQGESLAYAGRRYSVQTIERGDALQVEVDGVPVVLEQESGGAVKAPSPAVVLGLRWRSARRWRRATGCSASRR